LPLDPGGHVVVVRVTAVDGVPGRRLRVRLLAHPARLRELRQHVRRWAEAHTVPTAALDDLQLALGEAVSNGIEHAYRDRSPGTVDIELAIGMADDEPVVEVSVSDHGQWRPIPLRPRGRGRGLTIISQLARQLDVATSTEGTRLTFVVPVRG
jgi:anti-sigma regulatory factor (Ser/Thr protein kinase)